MASIPNETGTQSVVKTHAMVAVLFDQSGRSYRYFSKPTTTPPPVGFIRRTLDLGLSLIHPFTSLRALTTLWLQIPKPRRNSSKFIKVTVDNLTKINYLVAWLDFNIQRCIKSAAGADKPPVLFYKYVTWTMADG